MLKLFKFYLKPQCENSSQKIIKGLSFKGYFDEYFPLMFFFHFINFSKATNLWFKVHILQKNSQKEINKWQKIATKNSPT
jgi:hypothetical protein